MIETICNIKSHEVLNSNAPVIAVSVNGKATETLSSTFCKWVGNDTISGLEANLGLEGVLSDGTYHL